MTGHDYIKGCLPGYALGSLDKGDAELVSRHLPGCETCRSQLQFFEETVGLLALGTRASSPRDSLKSDLMIRIQTTGANRRSHDKKVQSPWRSFFEWFSPVYALASLLVIFTLAAGNIVQWQQAKSLNSPLKIIKMRGTSLAPQADGTFIIGQNPMHGVLVASDLPPIQENQQFQLWMTRNDRKISGGVFSTTTAGYGRLQVYSPSPLTEYQGFSITIEPSGGSKAPSTPELMYGLL
jgi:anti-sigma-K factor RskA